MSMRSTLWTCYLIIFHLCSEVGTRTYQSIKLKAACILSASSAANAPSGMTNYMRICGRSMRNASSASATMSRINSKSAHLLVVRHLTSTTVSATMMHWLVDPTC